MLIAPSVSGPGARAVASATRRTGVELGRTAQHHLVDGEVPHRLPLLAERLEQRDERRHVAARQADEVGGLHGDIPVGQLLVLAAPPSRRTRALHHRRVGGDGRLATATRSSTPLITLHRQLEYRWPMIQAYRTGDGGSGGGVGRPPRPARSSWTRGAPTASRSAATSSTSSLQPCDPAPRATDGIGGACRSAAPGIPRGSPGRRGRDERPPHRRRRGRGHLRSGQRPGLCRRSASGRTFYPPRHPPRRGNLRCPQPACSCRGEPKVKPRKVTLHQVANGIKLPLALVRRPQGRRVREAQGHQPPNIKCNYRRTQVTTARSRSS